MTLHQLLTEGEEALIDAGIQEAALDARCLLLEAFHTDTMHFLMNRMRQLAESSETDAAMTVYREMIAKRSRRIPLQHILGQQEFMGLTFKVNEHVLIPRQDTETLVELVLEEQQDRTKKVLDLCTGSGCIAISLAVKGGYEDVTAADLSTAALGVAEENARMLLGESWQVDVDWKNGIERPEKKNESTSGAEDKHCSNRFSFCQGDLFGALAPDKRFDILVSNPPYIPTEVIRGLQPEVRDHEPMMALDGTGDGLLFYRRIAHEAKGWLNPGGSIYLEIGHDQGDAVSGLLKEAGFDNIRVVKDLPGLDRVVCADLP